MREDKKNDPVALRTEARVQRGLALTYRRVWPEMEASCLAEVKRLEDEAARLEAGISDRIIEAGMSMIAFGFVLADLWLAWGIT